MRNRGKMRKMEGTVEEGMGVERRERGRDR